MFCLSIGAQIAIPPVLGDGSSVNPYQISSLGNLYWLTVNPLYWNAHYQQTTNINASPTVNWNQNSGWWPIGYYGDGGDPSNNPFTGSYDGQGYVIDGLFVGDPLLHGAGLFGFISGASITNLGLTNVQVITSPINSYNAGALAGFVENNSIISHCYSTGIVNGHENVGGLVGYSINSSVENCQSSCEIQGESCVGGLVGGNGNHSTIHNSSASGNVSATLYGAGGLAGYSGYWSLISNSFCTGNSFGYTQVGGFVGFQMLSTIRNCFSRGNVTVTTDLYPHMGGFIGLNQGDYLNFNPPIQAIIENCYSTGSVFCSEGQDPSNKGFAGFDYYSMNSSNFFDSDVSNQNTDDTGVGAPKTTQEMTTMALVTPNIYVGNGWDFVGETINGDEDIWNIGNGRNNGYPYLCWEYPEDNPTLPVTLSSFTAVSPASNTVNIAWVTQSENNLLGYHIFKNNSEYLISADRITISLIPAFNQSNEQNYSFNDTDIINNTTYYYWLQSVEANGSFQYYGPTSVTITHDIVPPLTNDMTTLDNVYPNPLKQAQNAHFDVKVKDNEIAALKIFNIKGQLIKQYSSIQPGIHKITWNGKDSFDKLVANGVYFYQLSSPSYNSTKKVLLIK